MTFKERAKELKRDVPAVFLAIKDRDTPLIAKALAGMKGSVRVNLLSFAYSH